MKAKMWALLACGILLMSCDFHSIMLIESEATSGFLSRNLDFSFELPAGILPMTQQPFTDSTPINYRDALYWEAWNIHYKSDIEAHGHLGFYQTPKETLALGTGDCKDFSLLALGILEKFHIDGQWVFTHNEEGKAHAVILLNGRTFDPQIADYCEYPVELACSYQAIQKYINNPLINTRSADGNGLSLEELKALILADMEKEKNE